MKIDIEDVIRQSDKELLRIKSKKRLMEIIELIEFYLYIEDEGLYESSKEELERKYDLVIDAYAEFGDKVVFMKKASRLFEKAQNLYWEEATCEDVRKLAKKYMELAASYGYDLAMAELRDWGNILLATDAESSAYDLLSEYGNKFNFSSQARKIKGEQYFQELYKKYMDSDPSIIELFEDKKRKMEENGIVPPWISAI